MKKILKKVLPIINILLMAGVPTAAVAVAVASVLAGCGNPSGSKNEVVNHNITAAEIDKQDKVKMTSTSGIAYRNVDSLIAKVLNADTNDTVTLPVGKEIAISYQYLYDSRVILNKADVKGVLNTVTAKNVFELDAEGYNSVSWVTTGGGVPGIE